MQFGKPFQVSNPPISQEEDVRIQGLKSFDILSTRQKEEFNALTRLATLICYTPVAPINLIDTNFQWTKACVGMDSKSQPCSSSFCQYTIMSEDILEVSDLKIDSL